MLTVSILFFKGPRGSLDELKALNNLHGARERHESKYEYKRSMNFLDV